MKIRLLTIGSVSLVVLAIFGLIMTGRSKIPALVGVKTAPAPTLTSLPTNTPVADPAFLAPPLSDALSRVTKKGFGLNVSPKNSPVQPERFSGYHTGVDFETLAAEKNLPLTVATVCNGPLLLKKWASGYGGVAVQRCELNNETVTIIYGHLKISSVTAKVGNNLATSTSLGILGQGYSSETDGERKHLHLGIHRGAAIDLLGYVSNPKSLSAWLDIRNYLKK